MSKLSHTPLRLETDHRRIDFYLCHGLSSWLGIDQRKAYDERHPEDIPVEVSSIYGPFTVFRKDYTGNVTELYSSDDFLETLRKIPDFSFSEYILILDKNNDILLEARKKY